ncbi:putative Thermitase [Candidatus Zixiibacteriota bacterium]|nr:putative Thermitase [candidate division Zixibacteria bacterium]
MKKGYRKLLKTLFLLMTLTLAATVTEARFNGVIGGARPTVIPGRLEVQFEANVSTGKIARGFGMVNVGVPALDQILDKYHVNEAQQMFPWRNGEKMVAGADNLSQFFEIQFPESVDLSAIISDLSHNSAIRSVSPVWAIPVDVTPNDPNLGNQWYIPKIMAPAAWDSETGSDTAKIAIADTGVLYSHTDLIDKIWVNPGEDIDSDGVVYDTDDLNGVDDDHNGIIDDLIGYDFFTGISGYTCWTGEDCGAVDTDPRDFNGHGTNCAGIAAATTNNGVGGTGIAGGWGGGMGPYRGPRIMCLRVGGSYVNPDNGYETGYVNSANCAQAIDYAAKMGACVLNASWGSSDTPAMRAACNRANDSGMVITHAAGNDGSSTGYSFLDTYQYNGYSVALTVAATGYGDQKSSFSNYGNWIDVSAPGEGIYNTYSNHYSAGYAYLSGTSMAAPCVAGLAALVKSTMPQFGKREIDTLIMYHADTIDYLNPGYELQLGTGRINACSTLSVLPVVKFSAGPTLVGKAPLTVNFTDQSPVTPSSWNWDFGDGGNSALQNPSHQFTHYGLYTVSLTAAPPKGTATRVLKNLVMVTEDTLRPENVHGQPGQQVVVPVYLDNKFQAKSITFPFHLSDSVSCRFDSVSVAGLRTSYFASVTTPTWDENGQRFTVVLRSNLTSGSTYLRPGTGPVMNLYITLLYQPAEGFFKIDTTTLSGRSLKIESIVADYVPAFKAGTVYVSIYQRGDANMNGTINILDVSYIINFLYKGGLPPDPYAGDVNGNGTINILDVSYLISYLYKGGPPPPVN